MDVRIIRRSHALAFGRTRYFTGYPCKNGHIAERKTANKSCVICDQDWMRRFRKMEPARYLAYARDYRVKNAAKVNAKNARRNAAKMKRTPPWLTQEHLDEIRHIYLEREILSKWSAVEHHVDHIVPLLGKNVSGLHVPWNLQIITAKENTAKRNLHHV